MLETIAFDADDTLWHNERFFRLTQDRFADLLDEFAPRAHLEQSLLAAERRNLGRYGFGIKGFVLSMIETAIDVTEARVSGEVIRELVMAGHEMLAHPIELLPHAREAIAGLAGRYRILLITKGDLIDQERKLAQSGLGDLFDGVEIVSHKTAPVYDGIFRRLGHPPSAAMMVGNSLRSDVLPVLGLGGWGVHIPHELTWALEEDEVPEGCARFRALSDLGGLLPLIESIERP